MQGDYGDSSFGKAWGKSKYGIKVGIVKGDFVEELVGFVEREGSLFEDVLEHERSFAEK